MSDISTCLHPDYSHLSLVFVNHHELLSTAFGTSHYDHRLVFCCLDARIHHVHDVNPDIFYLDHWLAVASSVFSQKSFQSLHNIVQHCARLCNCRKLTSWQPNQLCIESYKFTFSSLATQAAFILGKFVHLYRAYLHFLNISEQYLFRNTSCTKRFNFRKSLKKPQKVSNLARKMWFCWCASMVGI